MVLGGLYNFIGRFPYQVRLLGKALVVPSGDFIRIIEEANRNLESILSGGLYYIRLNAMIVPEDVIRKIIRYQGNKNLKGTFVDNKNGRAYEGMVIPLEFGILRKFCQDGSVIVVIPDSSGIENGSRGQLILERHNIIDTSKPPPVYARGFLS